MIDVLFHVSTAGAARILVPIARACRRAGRSYACFFTDAGVTVLDEADAATVATTGARAVACEESWHRFRAATRCPVTLGSQTDNSALFGAAVKVLSL